MELSSKPHDRYSAFQVDISAIMQAEKQIKAGFSIFSDSQAAIKALDLLTLNSKLVLNRP